MGCECHMVLFTELLKPRQKFQDLPRLTMACDSMVIQSIQLQSNRVISRFIRLEKTVAPLLHSLGHLLTGIQSILFYPLAILSILILCNINQYLSGCKFQLAGVYYLVHVSRECSCIMLYHALKVCILELVKKQSYINSIAVQVLLISGAKKATAHT